MAQLNWPFLLDLPRPLAPGSVASSRVMAQEPISDVCVCTWNTEYKGLIIFGMKATRNSWQQELYYYMPISDKRQEIGEEVQTILDLLRAGGVAVADEVTIDLGELE